jgi:hypothetical protein
MILDLLFLFLLHELLILLRHLRTVEVAEVEGQALRGVGQQLQLRVLELKNYTLKNYEDFGGDTCWSVQLQPIINNRLLGSGTALLIRIQNAQVKY